MPDMNDCFHTVSAIVSYAGPEAIHLEGFFSAGDLSMLLPGHRVRVILEEDARFLGLDRQL